VTQDVIYMIEDFVEQ